MGAIKPKKEEKKTGGKKGPPRGKKKQRSANHSDALLWSTVGINLAGSFLLGLLVAEHWFGRDLREGLGVGFLGGFTTFSTFSVQVVLEVEGGRAGLALAYVLISVLGGIAAATAGYALGRSLA